MVLVLPDIPTPHGAPTVDLGRLSAASIRLGGFRVFSSALTGSYSRAEMSSIQRVYSMLREDNVLSKLGNLSFAMKNEADSRLNWLGGEDAVIHGATFGPNGFVLDGVDDWIDPVIDLTGSGLYKVHDAHVGVYVSVPPPLSAGQYSLLGRIESGAGATTRLLPRAANNTESRYRINNAAAIGVTAAQEDQVGLWHVAAHISFDTQYLFLDDRQLAQQAATFTANPSSIVIGRQEESYSSFSTSGWFAGAYLDSNRRPVLSRAFEIMWPDPIGWSGFNLSS